MSITKARLKFCPVDGGHLNQYKIKNDDDTIEPPTFEELDDEGEEIDSDDEEEEIANDDESLLTKHGLKYGCDYTVKFVPDGTPSSFINDDDTLSKECLRIIKSTDKTIAHESFRLHKQHAHDYYKKAKEWCWYYPEVSKREKLKTIFLSAVATVPGTVRTKTISALLVFFAQYGIYCIDSYFDMEHNLHMSKYHFQMVDAYRKHIKNNGW